MNGVRLVAHLIFSDMGTRVWDIHDTLDEWCAQITVPPHGEGVRIALLPDRDDLSDLRVKRTRQEWIVWLVRHHCKCEL